MSSQPATASESRFDRWWWRVWYVFFATVLVWLGVCAWLMRPAPNWTEGTLAWWSGDRQGNHPSFAIANLPKAGNQIAYDQNGPAYVTEKGSSIHLGRLPSGIEAWTWTGWVHVTNPNSEPAPNSAKSAFHPWDPNFVVFSQISSLNDLAEIGVVRGRLALFAVLQESQGTSSQWRTYAFDGGVSPPFAEWFHVGIARDGDWVTIWLNGTNVISRRTYISNDATLGTVTLRADFHRSPDDPTPRPSATYRILHDDLVLFNRILGDEEVANLHRIGRGGWVAELARHDLGKRVWSFGWPAILTIGGLLLVLKFVPRLSGDLLTLERFIMQPHFRPVRWIVAAGVLASTIATFAMTTAARRADELRFNQAVKDFENATDLEWERIAGLCVRAKDWVSAQTNLTQDAWENWLIGNRCPYDYPGLAGIGYAEQVLPSKLHEHEATWGKRHGFPYKVSPGKTSDRLTVRELEGNPLLPIVVYRSSDAKRVSWFTNHTFLGRDLLYQSTSDRRPWAAARRVEESAARNEIQTSSLEEIGPAAVYGSPLKGIQIYAPNTRRTKKDDPAIVLESAAWRGVAFADVHFERMLLERLGKLPSPLGFKIFTGNTVGERHDLVADSSTFLPSTGTAAQGRLKQTAEIRFYYRRLYVDFWTTPAFEDGSLRKWAWFFGAGGVGMTALAASLVVVQIRARKAQDEVLMALKVANAKLVHEYQERQRISRDLHDGSIQNLYALGLHLQRVQALFGPHSQRAWTAIKLSLDMLERSIVELRRFILSPDRTDPASHTPLDALHELVKELRRTTDTEFVVTFHEESYRLSKKAGTHLLRMAHEGISNALRHGKARRIELQLERCQAAPKNRSRWVFEVRDDGRGFDVSRASGNGLGLKHLKARAAELEGECVVKSELERGTTIRVVFIDRESSGEVDSSPQSRTE